MNAATSDTLAEQVGRIADEFQNRLRRGESPTVDEYVAAHPTIGDLLRGVLPLVRPADLPPPPDRFGEFRVVREIGRGGMGVVYEAVQEPLGRRVALVAMALAAVYLPLILVGGALMSEPLFAAFLLGYPTTLNIVRRADYSEYSKTWGFFMQDDWRVTNKLTLNLGLRYEFETPLTERQFRLAS